MDREDAIVQFMSAIRAMEGSDYDAALSLFLGVENELYEIPALHYNISIIYLGYHQLDKAEESIKEAIKLDSENIKYLKHYFELLKTKAEYSSAIDTGNRILQLQYIPEVKLDLAFLLLRTENNDQAMETMNELLNEGSNEAIIYFSLALLNYQLQKYQVAEGLVQEAIKQNYRPEETKTLLIAILQAQGKHQEIIDLLQSADYSSSEDKFTLAKMYQASSQLEDAIQIINDLLIEDSTNQQYLCFKGHLLREQGNHLHAITLYDQVLDQDQNNLSAIKARHYLSLRLMK